MKVLTSNQIGAICDFLTDWFEDFNRGIVVFFDDHDRHAHYFIGHFADSEKTVEIKIVYNEECDGWDVYDRHSDVREDWDYCDYFKLKDVKQYELMQIALND